jgi:hypothetical protein
MIIALGKATVETKGIQLGSQVDDPVKPRKVQAKFLQN